MAETFVENEVCRACQADIRLNALFCYHCGASVTPKTESVGNNGISKNADLFIDIISGGEKVKNKNPPVEDVQAAQIIKEKTSQQVFANETSQNKTKLKSAASLRRKSKIIQPKKVEISWEASETAPNTRFIIVALAITLFAVGVLYLALQLR